MDADSARYYKERALLEFSPSSPKLRLGVIAYLLENGVTEDLVARATELTEWVASGTQQFYDEIDALVSEDEDAPEFEAEVKAEPGSDPTASGYL